MGAGSAVVDDLDVEYMKMALALAARGCGHTSPNPMVGAVVVKGGEVVGRGWHERCGGPHAEVNAIDDAGPAAADADIYVTLEPCNHTGKTPPCTEKILAAGIRRVVVAMKDPNPLVAGGGIAHLEERGVAVTTGVCEAEAQTLIEDFVKFIRTGTPFVILKCASTLDGRIATKTGDSKWVTGPAARAHVHEIRHAVDGIMVGVETVRKDDPSLTTRLGEGRAGKDPVRVILDSRLTIPEESKMLTQDSNAKTVVATGPGAPEDKVRRLAKMGVEVVEVPLREGKIDLPALMERLGALKMMSLLIEGGGRVVASALSDGIVDKICFFYAPKILGGDDGVSVCSGAGPDLMADAIRIRNLDVRRFGDDVMFSGYIEKKASA